MFTRDLVVLDLECTGLDVQKHEIIQIAAIRINKDSLAEVGRFSSYVKPTDWDNRDPAAMAVNRISYDMVASAPDAQKVLEIFENKFPAAEVLLAAYNTAFDIPMLKSMYARTVRRSPFDFHSFDIWALAYLYWGVTNQIPNPERPIGFTLSDVAAALGVPPSTSGGFHNAIADVEAEVEILRRLLSFFSVKRI
ncbi:MAG: 3'-5' exonuclease [Candidatus Doudnabacteria bacterium]|nr:3'-5' exonuclease [Candidatus Doudnabacteria bacterium]